MVLGKSFSTLQNNTALKLRDLTASNLACFSTLQNNTALKLFSSFPLFRKVLVLFKITQL